MYICRFKGKILIYRQIFIMTKFLAICLVLLVSGFYHIYAEEVSLEKAKTIGKNVYYERANLIKKVSFNDIFITEEFSIKSKSQALYYIFNINENEGFIIISADDIVYPVLAYSFKGEIDPSFRPPNFTSWLDNYEKQIIYAKENNLGSSEKTRNAWIEYSEQFSKQDPKSIMQVNPLVSSTWNQGGFYNDSCPAGNTLVGCVAVAIGQVMRYHNSPTQGTGSHSYFHPTYGTLSANFGATTYNWSNMPDDVNSPNSDVAQMLYHCGVATDMNYSPSGSGTISSNARNALISYFNYAPTTQIDYKSGYTQEKWDELLRSELDAFWPLYYAGTDTQNMSAHAFVCDSYQGSDHFHFNWGWGGYADGYFLTSDLSPGSSNFNYNQHIIKIRPAGTYDFCWGLTFLDNPSGNFDDGSGNHFYNNNSSCRWIIQPPGATSITVNFSAFDTESGADKVNIFDGDNMGSPLLGSFSGINIPSSVTSTSGKVLIMFTSDSYLSGEGWEASYTSITTGIYEKDKQGSFSVYPNPGQGVFEIELINETTGDLNMVISELSGRQIKHIRAVKTESTFNSKVDLTELTAGMYFLSLELENLWMIRYIIIE